MLDSGGSELFVAIQNCWRLASVRRTRPHRFGGSGGILGRKTFLRGSTRDPQQFVARDFGPVKSTRDSSWETLGFVLHADRQSDYGRGVALHTSLGCVWNPIHSPRLRSWNFTPDGLRRRRENLITAS